MSSDFEEALRRTLQIHEDEQSAQRQAEQKAQRHKLTARTIAEPVLRDLGPQVAKRLQELNVSLQTSPNGNVHYWDFSPHYLTLSEDGLFMRPYTLHDYRFLGTMTANTGLSAEQEFALLLDSIHLIKNKVAVSAVRAQFQSNSACAVLPETYGSITAHPPNFVAITVVENREWETLATYPLADFLGWIVASMVSYGNASQALEYAKRETRERENRLREEESRRIQEQQRKKQEAEAQRRKRDQARLQEQGYSRARERQQARSQQLLREQERQETQERLLSEQRLHEQNQEREQIRQEEQQRESARRTYVALKEQGEHDLMISPEIAGAYLSQVGLSAAQEFQRSGITSDGKWKASGLLNALLGRSFQWWRLADGLALTDNGEFIIPPLTDRDWSGGMAPPAIGNKEVGILLDGPDGPWMQIAQCSYLYVDRRSGTVYMATQSGAPHHPYPYYPDSFVDDVQFVELSEYLKGEISRRARS